MAVSRKIQFKKFEKKNSQINCNFELFSPGMKLFYLHWAGQQRFSLNSGLLQYFCHLIEWYKINKIFGMPFLGVAGCHFWNVMVSALHVHHTTVTLCKTVDTCTCIILTPVAEFPWQTYKS